MLIAQHPRLKRLQDLLEHVEHVRKNCETIATHLIERDEFDLGRRVIARGRIHDASKFDGIEWEHIDDEDPDVRREAWIHHVRKNDHHPEYWNDADIGIHLMTREAVAELVADWASRSTEFGSDLREWIWTEAMPRYGFCETDRVFLWIEEFLGMLLKKRFC